MPPHNDDDLRSAVRRAATKQRQTLKMLQGKKLPDGLILPSAAPSPEHYHIVYEVPQETISVVGWTEIFVNSREGYERIATMARKAEPNTEWYDDGSVGFETRLHGRTDLWWIICSVAACIKVRCSKTLQRQGLKKRLILIPGDEEKT